MGEKSTLILNPFIETHTQIKQEQYLLTETRLLTNFHNYVSLGYLHKKLAQTPKQNKKPQQKPTKRGTKTSHPITKNPTS